MKILDLGQCGFDGPNIKAVLQEQLGATVVNASTAQAAGQKLDGGAFDLILVNRVFAADDASGLDWIRQYKSEGGQTPVMLVSDHADAQKQAQQLGAVPGFGKANLEAEETLEKIRSAAQK